MLGLQNLLLQTTDNRETTEWWQRDDRETTEKRQRDDRETTERQQRDNRETTIKLKLIKLRLHTHTQIQQSDLLGSLQEPKKYENI